ncbi:MAG: hypothetical protein WA772_18475, partial [Candidatus Acidiferrales bacterium]
GMPCPYNRVKSKEPAGRRRYGHPLATSASARLTTRRETHLYASQKPARAGIVGRVALGSREERKWKK